MRQILSISVSPALKKEIDEIVESGMYTSTSEFMRDAVRMLKERAIIREIKASQRDAKAGKRYRLNSLDDLLK